MVWGDSDDAAIAREELALLEDLIRSLWADQDPWPLLTEESPSPGPDEPTEGF